MNDPKYQNVYRVTGVSKLSFRAVIRKKGEILLDKLFGTELEAAKAVADIKGVPLKSLLRLSQIDISAEPVIYKHVFRATNMNRAKPYRANITIKGMRSGKYLGYHRTQLEAAQAVANYLGCDISDIERDEPLIAKDHSSKPLTSLKELIPLDEVVNKNDSGGQKFKPRKLPVKRLTIKRRETIVSGRNLVSPIGESSGEGYGW